MEALQPARDTPGNDADVLLRVQDLHVSYDDAEVLRGVSMEIRRGDFACVIGPNGAGKSTLMKAIAGLAPISRGRVESRARQVGYVPQQLPIDPALPLTVSEFLSLRLSKSRAWLGAASKSGRMQITAQLAEIGAEHLLDRRLGRLSGGEFQRVLIAYALLNKPDLLLLDEPLTGVDMRGGLSFDGLLHHLHDHRRIAILMVSHDLHLVEHLATVVFCVNRNVCLSGPPKEVLKPENLAKAYGHHSGMVLDQKGSAFIPLGSIRK